MSEVMTEESAPLNSKSGSSTNKDQSFLGQTDAVTDAMAKDWNDKVKIKVFLESLCVVSHDC